MSQRWFFGFCVPFLAGAVILTAVRPAAAQVTWGPSGPAPPNRPIPRPMTAPFEESITRNGDPLGIAAAVLAYRYAVAVTYEDPILRWRGDMVLRAGPRPDFDPYMTTQKPVRVPVELTPQRTPLLDTAAMGKLLDAYHGDNPDAPRFRVIASRYGFHIVPDNARDENGRWAPAITPLDSVVSIPEEDRMASGHVQAIVDAAAKAAGVQIGTNLSPAHDSLYAANGLHLSRNTLLPIEIDGRLEVPLEKSRPYMFRWGVARAVARDALISLLEMSATTLRWNLGCDPNPERAKTRCGLNLTPLQVQITGSDGQQEMRSLHFDRCVKCPALPPPSAQK